MSPTALQLVLGEEEFLVERAVEAIVAEVRAVDPTAELRRIRAGETTPADLVESLSPSLFAEGRVVVLLAAHEAGKDLTAAVLEVAADLAEGMVLVVQHAGGARNKALVDALRKAKPAVTTCDRVTRYEERAEFVRGEARRAGGAHRPGRRPGADRGGRVGSAGVGRGHGPAGRRHRRHRRRVGGAALLPRARRVVRVRGGRQGDRRRSRGRVGGAALGPAAGRAVRADRRRVGRCGAHPRAGRRRGPGRSQPARGLAGHAAVEDPQGPTAGAALEPGARWPMRSRSPPRSTPMSRAPRPMSTTRSNGRCCASARPVAGSRA